MQFHEVGDSGVIKNRHKSTELTCISMAMHVFQFDVVKRRNERCNGKNRRKSCLFLTFVSTLHF